MQGARCKSGRWNERRNEGDKGTGETIETLKYIPQFLQYPINELRFVPMARHPVRYGILVFFAAYFVVITYFQSVHHRRAIEVASPSATTNNAAPRGSSGAAAATSGSDRHKTTGNTHNNAAAASAHSTGAEPWGSSSLQEASMAVPLLQQRGDVTGRKSGNRRSSSLSLIHI